MYSVIEVRSLRSGEIEMIGKNAAEKWVRDAFASGADFSELIDREHTQVAVLGGEPVAAGGFIPHGDNDAFSWALVGSIPRRHFVGICRTFRRGIEATPYRNIEAHCFEAFVESHRWCICLGFKPIIEPLCIAPDGRSFRRFIFRNDRNGN